MSSWAKELGWLQTERIRFFVPRTQCDEFAGVTGGYWFVVRDSGQVVIITVFISGEQLSRFKEIKPQLNQHRNLLKFSEVSQGDLGVSFTFLGFLLNFYVNQEKVKSAVEKIPGILRDMGIAPNLSCSGCGTAGRLECYKVGTYGARLLCPECLDKLKKFIGGGLHGYKPGMSIVKGYTPK
jgi:hypothetical protein